MSVISKIGNLTTALGGGGSTGGGSTGGGGTISTTSGSTTTAAVRDVQQTEVVREVTIERIETAISQEGTVTLSGTVRAINVAWNGFPGARGGYRIFIYQKDSEGKATNSKYLDVPASTRSKTVLLTNELIEGSPTFKNDFTLTPVVKCRRNVDLDVNPGAAKQYIAAYAKALLRERGGMDEDDLDVASFGATHALYPETIKRYIGSQTNIGALLNEAEAAAFGFVKPDVHGLMGFYLNDPHANPSQSFDEADYVGNIPIQVKTERGATYNEVFVDFGHSVIDGSANTVSEEVPDANYKYPFNNQFAISSILTDEPANKRLAKLYAARLKDPDSTITVPVRSKGFSVEIGNTIAISSARGFTRTGAFVAERWTVARFERDQERAIVDFKAVQLFPEQNRVRLWASDSIPVWGSASLAEKTLYGFWHDDNNMVDTEYRHSLWGIR